MNYLAHSFLSFGHAEYMTGQFIADDVKGKKFEDYTPNVQIGILAHRFVDSYTDQHPICLELRSLLRPKLGLFSSVAIDVIFDHLLASQWEKHHPENFQEYIQNVYTTLSKNADILTPRMRFLLTKMVENDWLGRYPSLDGLSLTMQQMASRIPRGGALVETTEILVTHRVKFENAFEIFFPELIAATEAKLNTFANR